MALAGSALLTVSTMAFALAPNVVVLDLARSAAGLRGGHHMGRLHGLALGEHAQRPPAARVRHRHGPLLHGSGDRAGRRLVRPRHLAPARVLVPRGRRGAHDPARSARSRRPDDRARAQLRALHRERPAQPSRAGRHHPLRDRPGVAGRDRSARAAPPALARRGDLAYRRSADDRSRVRSDLRARSPAGAPSASGRCAWAWAPRRRSSSCLRCSPPGSPIGAQLLLLVAVAPAFTIIATAMYPLSTRGADERGVSHGVVNGVLSVTWATAFAVGSLATGVLADRHGDIDDLRDRRRRVRLAARGAGDHRARLAAARARDPELTGCSATRRRGRRARSRRPRR